MAQVAKVDYILAECFLAVGQAVGSEKTVDFDAVTVVAPAVSAGIPTCDDDRRNASWAADRRRVTAVGRYLGQRVVQDAGGGASIDRAAAERASAEVERGCQMNATREAAIPPTVRNRP